MKWDGKMKAASTLVLCLVSPLALSQACESHVTLSDLFVFSQIAERPSDRKDWRGNPEPIDCPGGTNARVPALMKSKRANQDVLAPVASVWWRFVRVMSESGGQGVVGEE